MTCAQMSASITAVYCTPSVRYLRMLTNSFVAGALAASYVVVLILQLNPALSLNPVAIAPLALAVGLFYAVALTTIAYALLLVRALFGRDRFSPAWISVSVLA